MAGNIFGKHFQMTSFGESHGVGIGVVIDGCPAGLNVSIDELHQELQRRRPGQNNFTTERKEEDLPEILSGIFENKTTGAPITVFIRNKDARSKDYSNLKNIYRPSHADYTLDMKYGHRDYRGGGRSSARETATRVAAGYFARKILKLKGIEIQGWVDSIGDIQTNLKGTMPLFKDIESSPLRCPDKKAEKSMIALIERLKEEKDSTGGVVRCIISGCHPGLGEPVFDRFEAKLAHAMLSINASKGFEIGSGFAGTIKRGSQHNDEMVNSSGTVQFKSNYSGGVQGGITNGNTIDFKVAFKPVATIGKAQETIDTSGNNTKLEATGRHDPVVVPRAVPIVEAMAALVTVDLLLENKASKIENL